MNEFIQLVERAPTVAEYSGLIAAVGWRTREAAAIELAMRNSLYAISTVRLNYFDFDRICLVALTYVAK